MAPPDFNEYIFVKFVFVILRALMPPSKQMYNAPPLLIKLDNLFCKLIKLVESILIEVSIYKYKPAPLMAVEFMN